MNINPKVAVMAVCGVLAVGGLGYVGYMHVANSPKEMTAAQIAAANTRMMAQVQTNLPAGVTLNKAAVVAAPVPPTLGAGDMSGPTAPVTVASAVPPAPRLPPAPVTPVATVPTATPPRPAPVVQAAAPAVAAPAVTLPPPAPVVASLPAPAPTQARVSALLVEIAGTMEKATGHIVSIGRSFDRIHSDSSRT